MATEVAWIDFKYGFDTWDDAPKSALSKLARRLWDGKPPAAGCLSGSARVTRAADAPISAGWAPSRAVSTSTCTSDATSLRWSIEVVESGAASGHSEIRFTRLVDIIGQRESWRIIIDGRRVAKISIGEVVICKVEPGRHSVRIATSFGWAGSPTVEVSAGSGATLDIVCQIWTSDPLIVGGYGAILPRGWFGAMFTRSRYIRLEFPDE